MKVFGQEVEAVLKATPSITVMPGGNNIPYPYPSPADWRDHWIYFLLIDRFNNISSPPVPNEFPCNTYQGGNFQGIRAQLPYLKSLGVTAIWLSPVLINPFWFKDYWGGYGIYDFLRIEPRFCTDPQAASSDSSVADSEFREVINEAHALGIYVILDIVLNHTGDLFDYEGMRNAAPWRQNPYSIYWRDTNGVPVGNWQDIAAINPLPGQTGIWPEELQRNDYFRRQGDVEGSPDISRGDFGNLKELVTEYYVPETQQFPVRNILIRAYQYLIAKFDIDGYRIDTLQYVEKEFAQVFGNSMREYGLSIGKKNFFTFGEIWQDDDDKKIASFIGRDTSIDGEFVGVDAALDFPMRKRLIEVCKGFAPPKILANHFEQRRSTFKTIVSSHGEASRYFVTFLDNHDLDNRFHNPAYPGQTNMALTCLFTMQGIPCIYYGTEQGLAGNGDRREYSRQALWGLPQAFSANNEFYILIRQLSQLHNEQPALRYGRQYFRKCRNQDGNFNYAENNGGVIAFSRILNTTEILTVVNTSATNITNTVISVDTWLHAEGSQWKLLFASNTDTVEISDTFRDGFFHAVKVKLHPMQAVVLM